MHLFRTSTAVHSISLAPRPNLRQIQGQHSAGCQTALTRLLSGAKETPRHFVSAESCNHSLTTCGRSSFPRHKGVKVGKSIKDAQRQQDLFAPFVMTSMPEPKGADGTTAAEETDEGEAPSTAADPSDDLDVSVNAPIRMSVPRVPRSKTKKRVKAPLLSVCCESSCSP